MDLRPVGKIEGTCASRMVLHVGQRRYPILRHDRTTCLISAPDGARLRGVADIFDGGRHRAHCLVVAAEPEDGLIRLTYKRCTPVTATPPADYERP
jgi:hypothetical protein